MWYLTVTEIIKKLNTSYTKIILYCDKEFNKSTNLSNKVNNNDVQNDVRKDEICKTSFRADSKELRFVLRIHLEAKADWNKHNKDHNNNGF